MTLFTRKVVIDDDVVRQAKDFGVNNNEVDDGNIDENGKVRYLFQDFNSNSNNLCYYDKRIN